ncbi:SRPBCC family protein [Zhouia sp. PK063]|uniref:SRPBCC family protein n=1 Tax=Zhouia sp. PK063 TaxID=3373602 RepID=UPI0037B0586C
MHIESKKAIVNHSADTVFNFLTDVKNYEQLMPENNSKFEILEENKFVFALKGMPEIVLKMQEKQPNTKAVLTSGSDKVPFTLTADIKEIETQKTEVQLLFDGEFNAMMGMMIKGPITNFINTLSDNLSKI